MNRIVVLLFAMVVGVSAQMFGTDPFGGSQGRSAFDFTVVDTDIDESAFVLVAEGITNFTQMVADSTVKAAYLGSNGDTAIVKIRGLVSPSLNYRTQTLLVDGLDTVATDSTFHIFEASFLDSSMAATTIVFSRMASARNSTNSLLDSISLNQFVMPVAHKVFGANDSPRLERIHLNVFSTTEGNGIRFEIRVYPMMLTDLLYTTDYYILDYAYVLPASGEVVLEYGNDDQRGMILPSPGAIAVMARSDAANMTGKVRIVGSRKAR